MALLHLKPDSIKSCFLSDPDLPGADPQFAGGPDPDLQAGGVTAVDPVPTLLDKTQD